MFGRNIDGFYILVPERYPKYIVIGDFEPCTVVLNCGSQQYSIDGWRGSYHVP